MRSIVILLAGLLRAQELPHATAELGAFAFADTSGTRLISTGNPPNAGALHSAICGGDRVAVSFERRQLGEEPRQTAANFDRVGGDVYRVRGKVIAGATCFLVTDELAKATMPVSARANCSEIASARSRAVAHCWTMAGSPALLVEFARQDRDALASVVVRNGEKFLFADFPAEFKGEGTDIWRVDDGGVLDPRYIRVVFLVRRGANYVLGIDWAGAEGNNLSVFVSNGERFHKVIEDYWYRAPL